MPPMVDQAPDQSLQQRLRKLPSVDHLLGQPAVASLLADYPRGELVRVIRQVLERCRAALLAGHEVEVDTPALALDIRQRLYERAHANLRKVINATGIVLHTGLGRAPLAEEALEALADVAGGYCNLELDLESGRRGSRHDHLRELLRELCDVEDAMVVNNNAAATYLALNTFAAGREALVSRGQLVEIGGSYRMPDIMAAAHCRMVEVGTTNRTRIGDYEKAITEQTAVIVRVHTSNYRVVGFTESATLHELIALARRHHLVFIDDLGSGLLTDELPLPAGDPDAPATFTLGDEPTVKQSIAAGADLALFSGDKLLGGPQAGVIIGRRDLVEALRKNPLARAFRPGKLTLAALEATLRLYRDPQTILERVPCLRKLARSIGELRAAADELAELIAAALPEADVTTRPDHSEAGGGSLAAVPFPTTVVEVRPDGTEADSVAHALRLRELPIICRVRDSALVFDPRTLDPADIERIPGALAEVLRELQTGPAE